jgi:uncharacterized protein (TIGR03435 family)
MSASARCLFASALTVFAAWSFAQPGPANFVFEAASVKAGNPDAKGPRLTISPGGQVRAENVSLRGLIEEAYQIKPFQLTGGPRWMDSDTFEVIARGDEAGGNDKLRLMLQSLLAERFKLAVHTEVKEQTISNLVVKGNLKLKPSEGGGRFGVGTSSSGRGAQTNHIKFVYTTMARLADVLSRQMGQIVEDKTGLEGEYDFEFDATHEESEPNPFIAPYAPSLGQVGLKLESHRAPVTIVVVDRAEKPSPN